jgi:hypothetical protein
MSGTGRLQTLAASLRRQTIKNPDARIRSVDLWIARGLFPTLCGPTPFAYIRCQNSLQSPEATGSTNGGCRPKADIRGFADIGVRFFYTDSSRRQAGACVSSRSESQFTDLAFPAMYPALDCIYIQSSGDADHVTHAGRRDCRAGRRRGPLPAPPA